MIFFFFIWCANLASKLAYPKYCDLCANRDWQNGKQNDQLGEIMVDWEVPKWPAREGVGGLGGYFGQERLETAIELHMYYGGVQGKIRRFGVPNRIVNNSKSDSSQFGGQLQYESDSNNNFKSTIAILIQIRSIFG